MLIALFLLAACTGSRPSNNAAPTAALLVSGEILYIANCQACHGDQQGTGRLALAPSHDSGGHTWHHPDGQLLQIVMDGTMVLQESIGLPPTALAMPPFRGQLTQEEVLAILSYIKTWWTEEQRDQQAQVSRQWEEANKP